MVDIDVNKYLSDKLDIEFVNNLGVNDRVGTIVNVEIVTINDSKTRQDKELIELKVEFPGVGDIRTVLPNQLSLKNLKEAFGSKANLWLGRQVIPSAHMFPNKMMGVLLTPHNPVKEEKILQ